MKFLSTFFYILFIFCIATCLAFSKDGYLGINMLDNNTEIQKKYSLNLDKGILVTTIFHNSPADKSGLIAGDVILKVDNIDRPSIQDFLNYLEKKNPGQVLNFRIQRNNNFENLKIILGDNSIKRDQEIITIESQKFQPTIYYLGFNAKYPEDKINPIYLNSPIAKKYETKNPIVISVQKNSDAYKAGIKIYDEIIEVDNKKYTKENALRFTLDPVLIKIKRENQIISKSIIPEVYKVDTNADFINVPEISFYNCYKFYTGKDSFQGYKLKKLYKCLEENNVSTIPFFLDNKNFPLKLDTLTVLLGHYKFFENNKDEYQKIIYDSQKSLAEVDVIKKNNPSFEIPNSYLSIIDNLMAININNYNFQNRNKFLINNDQVTKELEVLINDNIIKFGFNNITTIKYIDASINFLFNNGDLNYLKSILNESIVKIDWSSDPRYIDYIFTFYSFLANIYISQGDYNSFKNIIDAGIAKVSSLQKTPQTRIAYKNFLNYKFGTTIYYNYADSIKFSTTGEWKVLYNYIEEFNLLSESEQKKILDLDPDYIEAGYYMLSVYDALSNLNNTRPTFAIKALEEIDKNPKIGTQKKIMIYSLILIEAVLDNNETLIKKTLFDIKNFMNSSKGNEQNLVTIQYSFGTLYPIYKSKNLYSEIDDLISFYEKTYDINNNANLNDLQRSTLFSFYIAKAEVEVRKKNYLKALENYKMAEKVGELDVKKISSKSLSQKISAIETTYLLDTMPDILDLYHKLNKIDEIKKLTNEVFRKDIDNLMEKDFEDILLLTSKSIKTFNVYLNYYYTEKNYNQIKLVLDVIKKNYEKIFKQDFLYSNNIDDYNNMMEISLKLKEYNLSEKVFNFSNNLVLQKYNESLFQSIWKPSITDSDAVINLIEYSNNINSDDIYNKAFISSQIIKNSNTSRDVIKAYLSKKIQSNEINEYINLQKDLISLSKTNELKLVDATQNKTQIEKLQEISGQKKPDPLEASVIAFNLKSQRLDELENKIKKNNPEFFMLMKVSGVHINDVQNKLKSNEAVLDYYFSNNKLALVIIKKDSYKFITKTINYNQLTTLKENVLRTLKVNSKNQLLPFDLKDAYQLNKILFLDFKDQLVGISKLYIVPDGPLNEIPIYALPKKDGTNCLNDCGKIDWNLNDYTFSYLASYENFIYPDIDNDLQKIFKENFSKIKTQIEQNKTYSELKEQTLKILGANLEKDLNTKNINQYTYLGIGDPDLYESKPQSNSKLDYERFFRSLSSDKTIKPSEIKAYYKPLLGSKEEIEDAAKIFGADRSTILLKENATISKLKQLDLNKFNIIHFATHAEISGKLQGVNEPFLVLSPPKQFTKDDNGILMMSEIMQLNTNADIVILSACNTGANEDSYSGSYTGLAKAFFVSGSKSVLVSDWQVETIAAQKLISLFIKKFSTNNLSYAENLKLSMQEFIKNNNKRSHPIFWAPFVFVGNDREINKTIN